MLIERKSPRRSTYKTGHIVFDGGDAVVRCAIRDLSDAGAALAIAHERHIPRSFDLLMEVEETKPVIQGVWRTDKKMTLRSCVTMWKSGPRLGVKFQ